MRGQLRLMGMKPFYLGILSGVALVLTGCSGFFVQDMPGTTSPGTSTGDYVYAVNTAANQLVGYSIANGGLTAITGLPLTLQTGLAAQSVTVTRSNAYVYAAGSGLIACYSIGTGGALTAVTGGGGSATAIFTSLETSPDGQWLLALDAQTLSIYVYKINATTGALTLNSTLAYAAPSTQAVVQRQIRIAPSGNVVAIALGTGGDVVFSFNTTNGILTFATNVFVAGYSDNALAFDANSTYLYIARGTLTSGASGIASYAVTSAGGLTGVQALATSGAAPFGLVFDSTGTYLYSANRGDATVSAYSASAGTLTALASAPYATGGSPSGITRDNSGKYIVSVGSTGTNDVTLFAQDALTIGKLGAVATVSTGAAGVVAIAATHTAAGL